MSGNIGGLSEGISAGIEHNRQELPFYERVGTVIDGALGHAAATSSSLVEAGSNSIAMSGDLADFAGKMQTLNEAADEVGLQLDSMKFDMGGAAMRSRMIRENLHNAARTSGALIEDIRTAGSALGSAHDEATAATDTYRDVMSDERQPTPTAAAHQEQTRAAHETSLGIFAHQEGQDHLGDHIPPFLEQEAAETHQHVESLVGLAMEMDEIRAAWSGLRQRIATVGMLLSFIQRSQQEHGASIARVQEIISDTEQAVQSLKSQADELPPGAQQVIDIAEQVRGNL